MFWPESGSVKPIAPHRGKGEAPTGIEIASEQIARSASVLSSVLWRVGGSAAGKRGYEFSVERSAVFSKLTEH